ncbi:MAG: hypothetical protein SynsKO_20700 [Synoicihabitans sp.]
MGRKTLNQEVLGDSSGHLKIVECLTCGHIQLNPPSYSLDYYEEDGQVNAVIQHYGTPFEKLVEHGLIEAKRRVLRFANHGLDFSKYQSQEPLSVLDVGGGYGFFASEFKNKNPNSIVTVVEPSKGRVATGKRLLQEKFPDRPLPVFDTSLIGEKYTEQHRGKYDVITLWHVLEHLTNPCEFLEMLGKLVKPDGGIVCVEVPNLDDELRNLSKGFNNRWFMAEHVSYFSPHSLRLVANQRSAFTSVNVFGYQRYGIFNYINWINQNTPEGADPDLFDGEDRWWLEKSWRSYRESSLTSDALYMVCKK